MNFQPFGVFVQALRNTSFRLRHQQPAIRRTLWKSSRSSAETSSLRLDVGGPDHLAPFLGFLGDQLAELDRRSRQRRAAEVSETGLHLRVVESRVDLVLSLLTISADVAFGAPRPYQIPPA